MQETRMNEKYIIQIWIDHLQDLDIDKVKDDFDGFS